MRTRKDYTDWSLLRGMRCICPPGCTDEVWGDNEACVSDCEPCTLMRGTVYTSPKDSP